MVIGNDTVLPCDEAIAIMVKISGHVFHMMDLLECSKDYGLHIGQKPMYELEGGTDFRNLSFHFLMRSLNCYLLECSKDYGLYISTSTASTGLLRLSVGALVHFIFGRSRELTRMAAATTQRQSRPSHIYRQC